MVSDAQPSEIVMRPVVPGDLAAIRDLHARAFSPGRFARTAYRVREGTGAPGRGDPTCAPGHSTWSP